MDSERPNVGTDENEVRTVLVVDPDAGHLILTRHALKDMGYRVLSAHELEEAVRIAAGEHLNAVVIDAAHASPHLLRKLGSVHGQRLPAILSVARGASSLLADRIEELSTIEHFEMIGVVPKGPDLPHAVNEALMAEASEALPVPEPVDPSDEPAGMEMAARLRPHLSERFGASEELARQLGVAFERVLSEGQGPEELLPEFSSKIALTGFIDLVPMDQILQVASSVASPARCRLEHADQTVDVFFEGQTVVYACQDNLPEGFTIGRFLVEEGKVSEAILEASLRSQQVEGGRLGDILMRLGALEKEDLFSALERQTSELVYEAVRWPSGRFTIHVQEELPEPARDADIGIPIQHLLMEGMRRMDDWHRMTGEFGGNSVLDKNRQLDVHALHAALSPAHRLLLAQIDGTRTIEDLIRKSRRPSYNVVKAIADLRAKELVTIAGTLSQIPLLANEPEFEEISAELADLKDLEIPGPDDFELDLLFG